MQIKMASPARSATFWSWKGKWQSALRYSFSTAGSTQDNVSNFPSLEIVVASSHARMKNICILCTHGFSAYPKSRKNLEL